MLLTEDDVEKLTSKPSDKQLLKYGIMKWLDVPHFNYSLIITCCIQFLLCGIMLGLGPNFSLFAQIMKEQAGGG